MQNIIGNFISGIILLFERPMRVGDVITLEDGTLGTVEKISVRSTTIQTPDAITITVPNSKFVESRITNWTHKAPMRGFVRVGVAYGSDTNVVKKCLLEIARQNSQVKTFPEPFVRFAEFGDSALIFQLYYWAEDPGKRWFAQSELNFAIDEVFRKTISKLHSRKWTFTSVPLCLYLFKIRRRLSNKKRIKIKKIKIKPRNIVSLCQNRYTL